MWKHCCVFVCALIAIVVSNRQPVAAQDPSSQPLVQFTDLTYVGAFRLPRAASNGDDLSFGGRPFAFNATRNSVFVGSRAGRIAEVAIPSLVSSTDINTMFFGTYLQGLADPLEGNLWQVATSGAQIEGLLVDGDKLIGTGAIYYDAQNTQRVSHYSRSTNLAASSFSGFTPVWQVDRQGFVSGYMSLVPPEWQARLGGRAVTGQCCTPIAWKTSWGPAAFAFNPSDIGVRTPVPASPLVYYTDTYPTLGQWNASGTVYGGTARIDALVLIAGTRSALFFGSIGSGTPCYGNGTSVQSLHNTPSPDGTLWCYDPTSTDKGQHAYPYHYQIWAYDLNEFAAVREGRKNPWDVLPYGVWPFDLPTPEVHAKLGGVAYDAQRQTLYISQLLADTDTFANRALVHAVRISGAPATLPAPTATTGPTPSGSGTVQSVVLSADRAAPQAPGTTITWQATATGGISPYQYKWMTNDGSSWTSGPWTSSSTLAWTPTVASPYARVSVWVRSYGATPDIGEAAAETYYPISGTASSPPPPTPTPTSRVTAVGLSANMAAPQPAGTTITWTATAVGGVAPYQYQWQTFSGGTSTASPWTTSNTFAWTPTAASEFARVAVWVRSAGNTANLYEASTERYFRVTAATTQPAVSLNVPATVQGGAAFTAAVANGPGLVGDWLGIYKEGESYDLYRSWSYLSGGSGYPAAALTQANVSMVAPLTAGTYYVRLYQNDSTTLRATSTPITVTPASVVSASLSGSNINVSVQSPPGHPADWVGLFPVGAADSAYVAWKYLDGTQSVPGTAVANPSFQMGLPVTSGAYEVRLFHAGGLSLRGTSAPLSIGRAVPTLSVNTTSVTAGGTVLATISDGPAQVGDWVGVFLVDTQVNQYRSWSYMNGVAVRPVTGIAGASIGFSMPSTPGTYEIRFYLNDSATLIARSPQITVTGSVPSVTISANMVAPQPAGTTVTWTALRSGGVAPYQYKWMAFDGVSWTTSAWTTSNTYAWTPANSHEYARVAVWVRSAGSTADNYEVSTEKYFAIR